MTQKILKHNNNPKLELEKKAISLKDAQRVESFNDH